MRIRKKLVAHTMFIALVTVILSTSIIGVMSLDAGKDIIHENVFKQLVTLREVKSQQVTQYFNNIRDQILVFSKGRTAINAMRNFNQTFYTHAEQMHNNGIPLYRSEVIKHYLEDFKEEYMSKNNGKEIDPKKLINVMDENSFSLQYQYILQNPNILSDKSQFDFALDGTDYSGAHKKFHPVFREFQRKFNLYDIFLVDSATGNIVYSVIKELDFTSSLTSGPYAKDKIGEAFRKANNATNPDYTFISDFAPYLPSYDREHAFISSPVYDENNIKLGVIIFELSAKQIDKIMTNDGRWNNIGLGETGESYLIASDSTMRSTSRFFMDDIDNYVEQLRAADTDPAQIEKIREYGSSVGIQKITSDAAVNVLRGKTGFGEYTDYRGVEVLGAYEPLEIGDLNWGIITEVDKDEAFGLTNELAGKIVTKTIIIAIIMFVISIVVGTALANQISWPIEDFSRVIRDLAISQDLTKRLDRSSTDELSDMADALNSLISSFQQTCKDTINSSEKVHNAAKKLIDMDYENSVSSYEEKDQSIRETGDNLVQLSSKLQNLSAQFKIFEEESDRSSGW